MVVAEPHLHHQTLLVAVVLVPVAGVVVEINLNLKICRT